MVLGIHRTHFQRSIEIIQDHQTSNLFIFCCNLLSSQITRQLYKYLKYCQGWVKKFKIGFAMIHVLRVYVSDQVVICSLIAFIVSSFTNETKTYYFKNNIWRLMIISFAILARLCSLHSASDTNQLDVCLYWFSLVCLFGF